MNKGNFYQKTILAFLQAVNSVARIAQGLNQ